MPQKKRLFMVREPIENEIKPEQIVSISSIEPGIQEYLKKVSDRVRKIEDLYANKLITTKRYNKLLEEDISTSWIDKVEALYKEKNKEKLHKQPRSLLKTVAQNIGNTTETPNLFTIPEEPKTIGALGSLKEEISKNTGALAFLLIQKYQENSGKPLEITNLSSISDILNCNNHRLKIYLLYLGGYVYPIIDRDEKTKELVLTNEQLFKIEFRYSSKVAEKYEINSRNEIQGVSRIGNNLLNFIKDEPLDRVIIQPNDRFIKALQGKGLGNILTVNDKFVGLILELSDIATKILTYSSSNKPELTIKEENLIKHLGLEKQTKTQGKPRVRATILKGFQELKDKEHIKSYSYDPERGMYSYTYSDKYVKFKQTKKAPQ
jgi:hypothetical protein